MDSIGDGDEVGDVLGIAAVVVVLLAEEEGILVVVGGEDIASSLLDGEQAIGDIGAEGAGSGGRFGAGCVEDRIGA